MPYSRNPFGAGFAAITIAILFGYYLPTFNLPKFDFNVLHGAVLLGHPAVRAPERLVEAEFVTTLDLQILGAVFSYFIFAVLLAYFYAYVFYPAIPGENVASNILKGLMFGFGLFLLYDALIFNRIFDFGPFFTDVEDSKLIEALGPPDVHKHWRWAIASLLFFVFYGMMLGLFYNPKPKEQQ
ncbi:MAG: hypothetical protein ACE5KW_00675 [Dehalococcoidia bacterium]